MGGVEMSNLSNGEDTYTSGYETDSDHTEILNPNYEIPEFKNSTNKEEVEQIYQICKDLDKKVDESIQRCIRIHDSYFLSFLKNHVKPCLQRNCFHYVSPHVIGSLENLIRILTDFIQSHNPKLSDIMNYRRRIDLELDKIDDIQ